MRIQFICKKNEMYSFQTYCRRSSGLYNSTRFIAESLEARGVPADIVEVQDNNCIDKEVTRFKPDICVIEALWVVPEKFEVLKKLHPNVRWFVHLHSNMPFLALEGIAMDWILRYAQDGIGLIANSRPSYEALRCILSHEQLIFLPNVYISHPRKPHVKDKPWIDVACFGAVRPLKNHLLQALAAIRFARSIHKELRFHINGTRVETGGQPVLKNLRQLFDHLDDAMLIESKWNEPEEFLDLLQTMDIGLQVSLTETFNVVTADYVTAGIPVVTSKEVVWVDHRCHAQDDSVDSIVHRMHEMWRNYHVAAMNQRLLRGYSENAQEKWFGFATNN